VIKNDLELEAIIGRMNLEVREYLMFHPSEIQEEEFMPTGTR
jgi:hypothetical protein